MTNYKRKKVEKLLARLDANVQQQLKTAMKFHAKYLAEGNKEKADAYMYGHSGGVDMLQALGIITFNELMLLYDYETEMAYEMAEQIKKGAA